jgi:hypothetical protein
VSSPKELPFFAFSLTLLFRFLLLTFLLLIHKGSLILNIQPAARGASDSENLENEEKAREAADCKAKKLQREMKKLSWDALAEKPAMNKATAIEHDQNGAETGEKETDFAFNSELMTECGDPKIFWDAVGRDGDEGEHWLQASGSECVNFAKHGVWRKKLRSEAKTARRS